MGVYIAAKFCGLTAYRFGTIAQCAVQGWEESE